MYHNVKAPFMRQRPSFNNKKIPMASLSFDETQVGVCGEPTIIKAALKLCKHFFICIRFRFYAMHCNLQDMIIEHIAKPGMKQLPLFSYAFCILWPSHPFMKGDTFFAQTTNNPDMIIVRWDTDGMN